MQQSAISIVIPVHNKWELTEACLRSLREYAPEVPFEVVVVDDASADETVQNLAPFGKRLFPENFVRLRNAEKRNFAGACNRGAESSSHDLLFFLNNDTVLTPGWDRPLTSALTEDTTLGAVGPLLLYEDDTVQHCGVAYCPQGLIHIYRQFPRNHQIFSKPRTVQFLTAAALLLPKELFFACGGFHEGYRNGLEDVDLCVCLGGLGKKLACIPESAIYHLEGKTRGKGVEASGNDALLFERCGASIYIDAHLHALRDGLTFSINDLLGVSVHLTTEEETRLAREAGGLDFEGWLQRVRENPLWLKGREILSICFEGEGYIHEAGSLRMEMANILPNTEYYRQLLRLAALAENPSWALGAVEGVETMAAFAKSQNMARAKVEHARQHFRHGRDILLENAYTLKLRTMGRL